MRSVASIKDRLKNYAKASGRTVQDVFTVYILERVLYRISISVYADHFTLKGGILLYGLYPEDFSRATTDIDLLGGNISNDTETLKHAFAEILSIDADDPIRFDLDGLQVMNITEFKKYHGVRIATTAFLERTRIAVGIDVGFGDVVFPERVKMQYPTLLDDASPEIYAYSIYSTIAEKMEAIISLGVANSRYKDFYDLCSISEREDLDGQILQKALAETFENRHTGYGSIAAFEPGFADDESRKQRWRGFLKNKNATSLRSFADIIEDIKRLMLPPIEALNNGRVFPYKWDHIESQWKEK